MSKKQQEEKAEQPAPLPLPKRRRQGQTMTHEERKEAQEAFLKALSNTANIRAACLQAGISRTIVYQWQEHDEDFGPRFKQANEDANWMIFGEAWRRAMQGEKEYVVSLGKLVYGPDGQPLTVQKKSDRLLELMLKARISEFREKGPTIVNVLPKEYINLPSDDGNVE